MLPPKNTAKAPPQFLDRLGPNRAILIPGSVRRFSSASEPVDNSPNYNFRIERKGEQVCIRHRATSWITEVTSCVWRKQSQYRQFGVLRGRSSTPAQT